MMDFFVVGVAELTTMRRAERTRTVKTRLHSGEGILWYILVTGHIRSAPVSVSGCQSDGSTKHVHALEAQWLSRLIQRL